MKKLVIAAAGLVVAVGGAVAAPHFIDWNKYKPEIQKAVVDATGYEVSLAGRIDLGILPFPHVVIEDVAVKVPGQGTNMLTLKKAEVSLALAPLFTGQVSVSSVNLVDPVVNLAVDKNGNQMWMTETLKTKTTTTSSPDKEASAKSNAGEGLAINSLEIENGTLNYNDASTGKKISVEKINTEISANTLTGPFKVSGNVLWNGQKLQADVKTGRIDKVTNTVSVEADLKLPESGATINYAGVVGTTGGIDLQGETQVQSKNLSATLTALSGTPSTLPPLSLDVEGIVTAKDTKADIKNLKLSFGDLKATGAIGVQNLKAEEGPVRVTLDLTSPGAFSLDGFMPVKSVKSIKAADDAAAPKGASVKSFLPDAITLPIPVDVQANISLAGLSYKDAEFGAVKFGLEKKGAVITTTENISSIPGGGTLSGKSTITFSPSSQGAGKSGVVYSDPGISFDVKLDSKSPEKLFAALADIKDLPPALKNQLAFNASGNVRGARAAIESGTVSLGQTSFNLGSSSYTLDPSGKNDVVLSVSGQNINLDTLMGTKVPAAGDSAAATTDTAKSKQALQDTLKKIDLPVDLTIKADLKNVTVQGASYAALNIDGGLQGNALNLKTASVQDLQGNVMGMSGNVKDVHTLTGVDMTLSGKTGDTNALLKSLKVDESKLPKDIGPLDLSVALTGEKPESMVFNAKAKVFDGEVQANGTVVDALGNKPAVDKVAVRIIHSNFERLLQKFSPTYKAGVGINKNVDVSANINLVKDGYDISGLNINLDNMNMTGTINAKTGGSKPDITAVLNAGTIPLDILTGKNRTAAATGPGTSKTMSSTGSAGRWSHDPVNATILNAFNMDLKVNAKSVEYGSWILNSTVLAVTVKDGTLNVGQMEANVYGGTMNLTANAKAGAKLGDSLSFETKADFKNVGLEPLAASFGGGTKLIKARGDVSLSLNAKSSGASPAALVSALSGNGQIDGKDVVLKGFDLAALSRSLVSTTKVIDNLSGLAGSAFSGGETAFDKIDGPFTIAQGNINFDKFLMQGPAATVTNKGQISLPRWYVDMATSIALTEPKDAPALEMKFQGPLDNPGNTFAGNAMQSYIQGRVGKKLGGIIDKKLGDKNPALGNLVNGLLGNKPAEPAAAAPAPAPADSPAPVVEPSATASDSSSPAAIEPSSAPATEPVQQIPPPAPTPEDQINNILQGIMGQ